MSVSRETAALAARFGLGDRQGAQIEALLAALAAEPDPHTTVSAPAEALAAHVGDALVALEIPGLERAARVADLGAGAGFPGLALAVALPRAEVDLVESASRKTAVIERLRNAAGLTNARVLPVRAEDLAALSPGTYDVVTARAVASLPVLVEYAAPLLRPDGVLVCWKGRRDDDEERAGRQAGVSVGMEPEGVVRVVPFDGARDRHLHVLRKVAETPPRFPRRAGMARKRPLA